MPSISERLAAVERGLEENNKTTWRVFQAIYGNGKPGLTAELQLLRQSVEKHHAETEQRRKEHKVDWQWIITTLIAVAAIAAVLFK